MVVAKRFTGISGALFWPRLVSEVFQRPLSGGIKFAAGNTRWEIKRTVQIGDIQNVVFTVWTQGSDLWLHLGGITFLLIGVKLFIGQEVEGRDGALGLSLGYLSDGIGIHKCQLGRFVPLKVGCIRQTSLAGGQGFQDKNGRERDAETRSN